MWVEIKNIIMDVKVHEGKNKYNRKQVVMVLFNVHGRIKCKNEKDGLHTIERNPG
jgi:hypothetical protein